MNYQTPPKEINGNDKPHRWSAVDHLTMEERTAVDEMTIKKFTKQGVQPGTNVFLIYDRQTNSFEYQVGNLWDGPGRYVGTIPEPKKGKS